MNTKHISKPILLSLFLMFYAFSLNAQWNIPEEFKNKEMPSVPTYKMVNTGKELFTGSNQACINCHGMPGDATNLIALNAIDLANTTFQNTNKPGEIFYKISTGKGSMPAFKDKLNAEEIWNLVYYIKSFDSNFIISGEKIKVLIGKIDLKADEISKKLVAIVSVPNETGKNIVKENVEVQFYVKRYFGDLPLGKAVKTSEKGIASFSFPDNIPGDNEGNIIVKAKFKEKNLYGSKVDSLELDWGTHLHFKNEVLDRTLWGPNDRVPIWLLISYLLVTLGVWASIIYVIFGILRIKNAGK